MSYFAGQLQPLAIRQVELEIQQLAHGHVPEGIHVAAAVREISNAGGVVSALAVPNSVERNIPSLSTPPLVHLFFVVMRNQLSRENALTAVILADLDAFLTSVFFLGSAAV